MVWNECHGRHSKYYCSNSIYQYAWHTTYYVSQKNNITGCEGLRESIVVTINSAPKPIITATGLGTDEVQLTSSVTTGNQWFKDGNSISGATAQTILVLEDGVYQVNATLESCTSILSEAITVIITGVEDPIHSIQVNIFPVPSREMISIHLSGVKDEEVSELTVFDVSGRLIEKQQLRGKEAMLLIKEYQVGDYFLRISNKSFLLHKRFVKY